MRRKTQWGVGGITYAGGNVSVTTSEEKAGSDQPQEGLSRPPSVEDFVTRGAGRGKYASAAPLPAPPDLKQKHSSCSLGCQKAANN